MLFGKKKDDEKTSKGKGKGIVARDRKTGDAKVSKSASEGAKTGKKKVSRQVKVHGVKVHVEG